MNCLPIVFLAGQNYMSHERSVKEKDLNYTVDVDTKRERDRETQGHSEPGSHHCSSETAIDNVKRRYLRQI